MEKALSFKKIAAAAVVILLTCVLATVFGPWFNATAEELNGDEFDETFISTLEETIGFDADSDSLTAERTLLSDTDLNDLGYLYVFEAGEEKGYCVEVVTEQGIKVTEIVMDAENPYDFAEGKNVYIKELTYAVYSDGQYYLPDLNEGIDGETLGALYPGRYGAIGDNLLQSTRTIQYISKSENEFKLATRTPSYSNTSLLNACPPLAGANVIAYYDRYKTNLLPDYTPGTGAGSIYIYKVQNSTIDNLIQQLYDYMGTNSTGPGNTVAQTNSGMAEYCADRNYTMSFTRCMSGGTIDYNAIKSALSDNKPVMIFMTSLELLNISEGSNSDQYDIIYGNVNHVLSVFGYREITYVQSSGTLNEKFLLTATGMPRMPLAYLNVNNYLSADDAYIVSIA